MSRALHAILILGLVMTAEVSIARSDEKDLNIQTFDTAESMTSALASPQASAAWHQQQADLAPESIKLIRARTIGSYFPAGAKQSSGAWSFGIESLISDARRLDEYSRGLDQSQALKNFEAKELEPAIRALTPSSLTKSVRISGFATPLSSWTVERLVTAERIEFLSRFPNFKLNVMRLLNGRTMRGMTAVAGMLVVGTAGVLVATQFGFSPKEVGSGVLGVIGGAFIFGPGSDIARSLAAWFTRPTQEFITTKVSRATGNWEANLNRVYTWLGAEDLVVKDEKRVGNVTPRFANVQEDGINFAEMNELQQTSNWQKNLRVWVSVRNTFMQLLRDVMHIGRIQQLISPGDEQQAKILVTTLELTRMALIAEIDKIVDRNLVPILSNHALTPEVQDAKVERLQWLVERYFEIADEIWRDPTLSETDQRAIIERSNRIGEIIRAEFRFSKLDMQRMRANRVARAKAIGAVITASALNEMRAFMTAEANRNLDSEARQFVRAVRKGLRLQDVTDVYLPQIQHMIRSMGYEVGDAKADAFESQVRQCRQLFVPNL